VGGILNMTGNERITFKINLYCSAITIVISLILIPTLGAIGAAISTAAVVVIQMSWLSINVRKILGFTPMNIFRSV
jgi:O-antigen/teichoic acid export membrane protein